MAQPLKTKKMPAADLLLDDDEIDELFARLKSISPDNRKRETVKDDRVAFRALVSCLLSAQSRDSRGFSHSRRAWRKSGRQASSPTELSTSSKSRIPSSRRKLSSICSVSASTRPSWAPRTSTPIWWNCRWRPFWGRSRRNIGPM